MTDDTEPTAVPPHEAAASTDPGDPEGPVALERSQGAGAQQGALGPQRGRGVAGAVDSTARIDSLPEQPSMAFEPACGHLYGLSRRSADATAPSGTSGAENLGAQRPLLQIAQPVRPVQLCGRCRGCSWLAQVPPPVGAEDVTGVDPTHPTTRRYSRPRHGGDTDRGAPADAPFPSRDLGFG